MNKVMAIRALTFALVLGCLAGVAAAAPAAAPLDIELAMDTTGRMGPSIKRIQRDAVSSKRRGRAADHLVVALA